MRTSGTSVRPAGGGALLGRDKRSRGARPGPAPFAHWQEEAARHLFRVAAGLDSMILGEGQVLGQVREAFELARVARPLGAEVSRLFTCALAVGNARGVRRPLLGARSASVRRRSSARAAPWAVSRAPPS